MLDGLAFFVIGSLILTAIINPGALSYYNSRAKNLLGDVTGSAKTFFSELKVDLSKELDCGGMVPNHIVVSKALLNGFLLRGMPNNAAGIPTYLDLKCPEGFAGGCETCIQGSGVGENINDITCTDLTYHEYSVAINGTVMIDQNYVIDLKMTKAQLIGVGLREPYSVYKVFETSCKKI